MSLTPNKRYGLKHSIIWVDVALFGVLFMTIYYMNSHDVYSMFITLIWVAPLILSIIYFLLMFWKEKDIGEWGRFGLGAGAATLMVFQALEGIYEIAQVKFENSIDVRLAYGFLFLAVGMIIFGIVMSIKHLVGKTNE